ncbi:MAG: glycosyltransferase family 2 protein, partial [Candidatus Moranbacteria bacterium]|nr:glycosyltransferase family 2 protein [Candidatus Moranbacteria bacterium]
FREVKTVVLNGPTGVAYARAKAHESVSPEIEIIAATDGDTFLTKKWLEKLTKPFENERVVATGGIVYFSNSIYANLMTLSFFFLDPLLKMNHLFYFWGASHAFRKSVYEKSGGLEKLPEIKEELGLHYWVDDLYLSLLLGKIGKVLPAKNSVVWTMAPKLSARQWLQRGAWQDEDRAKIFKYFGLE